MNYISSIIILKNRRLFLLDMFVFHKDFMIVIDLIF